MPENCLSSVASSNTPTIGNHKMSAPILVVVESPAKQKTIAKILGPGYLVRATVGHIMDLAKTKSHRLGVDIDGGFIPQYAVIPDKKDKIAAIIDAAKQSSQVYIASDPDREGEAIAFHIADQISETKKPIKRIMFKEITKRGLQNGISNPGDLNKQLYDAQQARRVLDRLVGFMVSPYLWQSFGPNLSAGRVQSVCLRLIVDREREIEAFVPEVYWAISATLAKPSHKTDKFVAKYTKKVTDEKIALILKDDLENSKFKIAKVEAKELKRYPPPPLTTAKLQQLGASRFKFPAKKTMSAAQGLYESGFVTYIRTDSTRSDPDAVAKLRAWLVQSGFDVPASPNTYKAKGTAQDAHEAIRPTDVSLKPDDFHGSEDQAKVYRLVWEHFVASQMNPAIFDTVAVTIDAERSNPKRVHELRANGRTLRYAGWLAVLQDNEKSDDDGPLPILVAGEEVVLVPPNVKAEKKQTQPPPRYNEGSLVKELEKRGIGRPSTYAAIIGKISDRNYVTKSKNVFTPTEIGCRVIDDLVKHFKFLEYEYTKLMEDKLDQIEVGSLDYVDMLSNFFVPFKDELKKAQGSQDKDGGSDCDKCGKRMKLKHGRFGYYIACSDHPKCKNTQSVELDGDKIVPKNGRAIVPGQFCPDCGAGMIKRDGKFGPFYSCSEYPKCKGTRKIPFGKKCPKCNGELYMTAFKGDPKLACMGYPDCKHVEDLPPGTKVNWLDPKKLTRKKSKKVEKILSK